MGEILSPLESASRTKDISVRGLPGDVLFTGIDNVESCDVEKGEVHMPCCAYVHLCM